MPAPVAIDGDTLSLEQIERVARNPGVEITLAPGAAERIRRSRAVIERVLESGRAVYGVTTGFGRLAETRISREHLEALQLNLIRSHACGVGAPLDRTETRAVTLLRANVLAKGFSGVRLPTVELLLELLNRGVHPIIPEQGSVGASGDLAPLSHLALVLVGEGKAEVGGEVLPGEEALRRAGTAADRPAGKGRSCSHQRYPGTDGNRRTDATRGGATGGRRRGRGCHVARGSPRHPRPLPPRPAARPPPPGTADQRRTVALPSRRERDPRVPPPQ